MSADVELADVRFREWMRDNLVRAAEHFGLSITGEPVLGWRLRSISAAAEGRGQTCWLRVASEQPQWLPGDFWTGNVDANVFTDLAKPRVLDMTEWDDEWNEQGWRRVRAEVMTFMPGHPCSPTDALRDRLNLPATWWTELRRTLDVIRSTPTERVSADQHKVTERVRAVFGDRMDLHVERWETIHGDLHWNNLLGPDFALLDWELWGRGPAATDAATLYCYSLLVPAMARKVREVLADILDTRAGRIAQVYVAARLLNRVEHDYPDLTNPLINLINGREMRE